MKMFNRCNTTTILFVAVCCLASSWIVNGWDDNFDKEWEESRRKIQEDWEESHRKFEEDLAKSRQESEESHRKFHEDWEESSRDIEAWVIAVIVVVCLSIVGIPLAVLLCFCCGLCCWNKREKREAKQRRHLLKVQLAQLEEHRERNAEAAYIAEQRRQHHRHVAGPGVQIVQQFEASAPTEEEHPVKDYRAVGPTPYPEIAHSDDHQLPMLPPPASGMPTPASATTAGTGSVNIDIEAPGWRVDALKPQPQPGILVKTGGGGVDGRDRHEIPEPSTTIHLTPALVHDVPAKNKRRSVPSLRIQAEIKGRERRSSGSSKRRVTKSKPSERKSRKK